jgi:hypothetical protein
MTERHDSLGIRRGAASVVRLIRDFVARVGNHRAELVEDEDLPVPARTRLRKKHRPAHLHVDRDRNDEHYRRQEEQSHHRKASVGNILDKPSQPMKG